MQGNTLNLHTILTSEVGFKVYVHAFLHFTLFTNKYFVMD